MRSKIADYENKPLSMQDTANRLNIKGFGRNRIFKLLHDKGIIHNNKKPLSKYANKGYFEAKENSFSRNGINLVTYTLLIYPAGIDFIRKLIKLR